MKKKRIIKICGIILLVLILAQNIMFRFVLNGYAVNDVYGDGLRGKRTFPAVAASIANFT